MVKAYLRYEPAISFGVIASPDGNITYDPSGRRLLAPSLEKISLWDLKKGLSIKTFSHSAARVSHMLAVTSIAASVPPSTSIASGHADGSIRLWDNERDTCEATLNGHKSAVTALRYNLSSSLLASGSKDCDVILWDVVSEAGVFRLKGHRDQVTDLAFIDSGKKLVTCSKDKFLRVWDLDTQHCLQIIGSHRSEIWSLDVDPMGRFLVSGSADPELRFYQMRHEEESENTENWSKWDVLKPFGEIERQGKDRVATIRFNSSGTLLACQLAGRTVEIYRVLDQSEATRKAKRRVNRKKKDKSSTLTKAGQDGSEPGPVINPVPIDEVTVSDTFKLLHVLRVSKKIISISFSPLPPVRGTLASLTLSLNNNMLETYTIDNNKTSRIHSIELQGHRSVIRSVTLNPEGNLLMSTSHNAVKIWNPNSGSCLRTIESGYGLCSAFVPGNRYALVGTKSGVLEIIDVGSGSVIESVEAHSGQVKSIMNILDGRGAGSGFVTGGDDSDVKFWEYQLAQKSDRDVKHLSVTNVRTLKMDDSVVSLCVSPDGKYVAVALLGDNKVKVFYVDMLKLFLSLHGHSLPVFCMDISSDGDLIVTGSADKTLKIWGLDFGDIHKTIFAHSDSVMDIKFVKNTHYVFSVGKDRVVKYWDADKFELLLTLEGHHAEIWCLAVSNRGDFIITGSHDRSIRRWDRTEEPFFLEEEKEKRMEEMFEADFEENRYAAPESAPEGAVGVPGKKTKETVTATDAIIDALDLAEEEIKRLEQHKEEERSGKGGVFQPNVLMRGMSASDYVLHSVSSVQTNDLEQTLLALPFFDALKLMAYVKEWARIPNQVELVSRVCTVLLQIHHSQLSSTPSARPLLTELKDILHKQIKECKDTIGFNLAAMDHLKELMSMRSDAPFRDAKAKLLEIRMQQSKRADPTQTNERRKKKRQKASANTEIRA